MSRRVLHKSLVKAGPFGGTLYTSLCGRLRGGSDYSLNVANDPLAVTCKYCLRVMARIEEKRA